MKFTEHRDPDVNMVRRLDAQGVWVNGRPIAVSFYMTRHAIYENWDVKDPDALSEEDLKPLLALKPEIILLGTGARQRFLPPALQAWCLRQGAGIETMNNDAACRTWNVLMTEDRPCLLALIQPPA